MIWHNFQTGTLVHFEGHQGSCLKVVSNHRIDHFWKILTLNLKFTSSSAEPSQLDLCVVRNIINSASRQQAQTSYSTFWKVDLLFLIEILLTLCVLFCFDDEDKRGVSNCMCWYKYGRFSQQTEHTWSCPCLQVVANHNVAHVHKARVLDWHPCYQHSSHGQQARQALAGPGLQLGWMNTNVICRRPLPTRMY